MSIGSAWVDGSWIDAGWVTGAWSGGSPPIPPPTVADIHTVEFSLKSGKMAFSQVQQRETTFNIESNSVTLEMIEKGVSTEFIQLTDGSFLLLTTGDKVIRSG